MTVESLKTKEVYLGNGSSTVFPVPFPYARSDDICLLITDRDGKETDILSNFTVTTSQSGDTSIIYPEKGDPLEQGQTLTVYRVTPRTQIVSLSDVGAFSPEELENSGFDRVVFMLQEHQEAIDRSIKIPLSSNSSPEDLLEEIFESRDQTVQASIEAQKALASTTMQANIAQEAVNAAEKAFNAVKNIEGFANATQAFHGITLDEDMNLLWVKGEDGESFNARDFLFSAILPTEARFFLDHEQLFVELPFTQ